MLLAEWPISDADAVIRSIRMQILQIFGLVILGTLLVIPFLIGRLVAPIQQLKTVAREVERGNFEKRVRIETNDELEELGEAFNKMVQGLKRFRELQNEFVFIASHELRTPVTVLRGYISMIQNGEAGPVTAKMKRFLAPIVKVSEALHQLVENLLQVARSEAGKIEIEVKEVSVQEHIQAVLLELEGLGDAKSITMIYQPQANLPTVLADSEKLKEIIKNLLDNAIKYTIEPGTVRVYHEVKKNILITHVEDTGVGIPRDRQKKIFQKFYRTKDERTQDVLGTGLGLWIVKQLIERMNGMIWFKSEAGKGSTFSFSLPLSP